jgi:hypothetical protein
MASTAKDHQFDKTDVLMRIIAPLGSALIALTQFPGTKIGNWFLVAVLALGLFISFNQTIEMLDRRYNSKLYEKGLA